MPDSPKHEFLVIETKDQEGIHQSFILERTVTSRDDEDPIPVPVTANLLEKIKKFVNVAYNTLTDTPSSPLAVMEEGSSSPLTLLNWSFSLMWLTIYIQHIRFLTSNVIFLLPLFTMPLKNTLEFVLRKTPAKLKILTWCTLSTHICLTGMVGGKASS